MDELFDTHAHLNDEQFDGIRDEVWRRAQAAGVLTAIAIGTTRTTSASCIALAAEHPGIHASVGIHPNYCSEARPDDWSQIEAWITAPKVVAVGETGLDRHWNDCPFPVQQDYFDRHLQLSQRHDRPVVIHTRECDADVLEMLRAAHRRGPLRGVMHSFTGAPETATECLSLGLHISFAGMLTYKKNDALCAIAATVPGERLLIETDSPYLSPHPHRAHRPNEPALIVHTAACLAEVRGISLAELAALTTANARRLFLSR